MIATLKSLFAHRRLIVDLVGRDLRARYVGSAMGFFWSVVFPLLNLVVYMFVFSFVLKTRWEDGQDPRTVALIMLSGIVVWQTFAETLSRSTNTLVENQNLIQKVVFPAEVLPASLALSALVNMLIGAAIALVGVVLFREPLTTDSEPGARALALGAGLVALPLLMGLQAVFTVGLGYLFSTLNLFARDVYHLMGVALSVWMFLTPIFYPASMVQKAGLEWVLKANPMYWLIESYRRVMLYGLWPQPRIVAIFGLVALSSFAVGSAFFRAHKARFPDLL
jgi:ABC-type polysaccharide/polyol phosphate export permease